MSDIDFKGLTEFEEKLKEVEKKAPNRVEEKLDELGKDLKKRSKEKTDQETEKKTGKLRKSYKLFPSERTPDGWEKTMTNTAPHFHLVEKGHRQMTKDGEEIGFVEGKHMVERAMSEMEEVMPGELDKWLGELFAELKK